MTISDLPEPSPRCESCGQGDAISYKGWRIMCHTCIARDEEQYFD